jgi:trimeric autotransporter adhesin
VQRQHFNLRQDEMKAALTFIIGVIVFTMNGQSWTAVNGFPHFAASLGEFNNKLYAGNYDTLTNSPPTKLLYEYTGQGFISVPGSDSYLGTTGDNIRDMIEFNGQLYIGGNFATLNGMSQQKSLVRQNGSLFTELGPGLPFNSTVMKMAVHNNSLYAAGFFTVTSIPGVQNIFLWNGSTFVPLGSGLNDYAICMQSHNSELFVGGMFTQAGGVPVNSLAKWNGTAWSPVDTTLAICMPSCMQIYNNELYIGGLFAITSAAGYTMMTVMKYSGGKLHPVGGGLGLSYVYTMEVYNGELYAAGTGTTASGMPVDLVGRWNGSTWSPVGPGLQGNPSSSQVLDMQARPDGLYVVGTFTSAGSTAVPGFARWSLTSSGTAELETDKFSVFPNPADDVIYLSNNTGEFRHYRFINSTGELVMEGNISGAEQKIDVQGLASGIYLLEMSGEPSTWRRVVVEH